VTAEEAMQAEAAALGAAAFTSASYKPGIIRHIVLFRYRPETTSRQREEARRRFCALAAECVRDGAPYIRTLEGGRQASGEGLAHGFEDAFIATFGSEGDRNYYVGAPIVADPRFHDQAHHRFKGFVGPLLADDGVLVFDFAVTDECKP